MDEGIRVSSLSTLAGSKGPEHEVPIHVRAVGNLQLCFIRCDAKMYHMKRASIRDLRYRFSVVENLLRDGHEIQITRRKRVIARLLPPEPPKPSEMPDFLGRMKKIFGSKKMKLSGAEQLAAERERF